MLKQARVVFYTHDLAGNLTSVNSVIVELLGYKRNTLLQKNILELTAPNDRGMLQQVLQRIGQQEAIQPFLLMLCNKDRDEVVLQVESIQLVQEGEILGVRTIARDVTQQHKAEQALHYQRALEQLILDISNKFIHLASYEIDDGINQALHMLGHFLDIDCATVLLYEEPESDALICTHRWRHSTEALPEISPLRIDDMPWLTAQLREKGQVKISFVDALPAEASTDRAYLQKHGVVSLIAVPIGLKGNIVGFLYCTATRYIHDWGVATFSMLSLVGNIFAGALERKTVDLALDRQEQRYRLAVQAGQTGIWVSNPDTDYLYFDNHMKTLLGYTEEEVENTITFWRECDFAPR